ncbi:hypothetical protein RBA63_12695 [Brenneria goodwinii]
MKTRQNIPVEHLIAKASEQLQHCGGRASPFRLGCPDRLLRTHGV